jgi:hypothetical protein
VAAPGTLLYIIATTAPPINPPLLPDTSSGKTIETGSDKGCVTVGYIPPDRAGYSKKPSRQEDPYRCNNNKKELRNPGHVNFLKIWYSDAGKTVQTGAGIKKKSPI